MTPQPPEGRHWTALEGGAIRCGVCPHRCRIPEGGRGRCFVRRNEGGRLRLASWNRVSGVAVDPVEKKPLYHFLPGSATLSLGGIGCNLACRFCQNASISQPADDGALGNPLPAAEVVRLARAHGCPSVSFTYNEPVVALEYVVECARVVRAAGLKSIAVTNGYVEGEARTEFFGCLDAANVDLKAFTDGFYRRLCGARLEPVKETLVHVRRRTGAWLEVTTLLIPGENDAPEEIAAMARWAVSELGADTPWHFSAFFPQYRLTGRPATPVETLDRARDLAMAQGLRYVYVGNAPGAEGHRTRCAGCRTPLLERGGLALRANALAPGGRCPSCGAVLPGVFAPAGAP